MLNAFPLVSFPSLSLEPSSVSSLPLTPSALIERGTFVWDSDAMQLAGVFYCAFLLTQRTISVQSWADSTLLVMVIEVRLWAVFLFHPWL